MKVIYFALFILLFKMHLLSAQIYLAKTSEINFFSEAPLENIEAVNKLAKPILNTATGNIQVKIPINGFKFPKPLMEEHFNENYMESEKFPNAIFKGKMNENPDLTKEGEYKVTVTGNMEMHGVTKEITIDGTITVKGEQLIIQSKFNIHIADYNIKVPSLYVKNIAEDVQVKINAMLEPFQGKK